VDKYDAIKHGQTANPGAQEQNVEQEEKRGKKQCVRRIHVISNILQDEMFEPPSACERASRQKKNKKGEYTDKF
jgi:hypothetical protein